MREMMRDYLKNNDISIKSGTDVNSVMGDMMSVLLEGVLDEKLGYSRYDYRNKDMDNSRNDISGRPYIPATEIWMSPFPVIETVSMNHNSLKSTRTP